MEQLAVLLKEAVAQPSIKPLAIKPNSHKQLGLLHGCPFIAVSSCQNTTQLLLGGLLA